MTGEEAAEILRAAFARQARERAEYEARAAADRAALDAALAARPADGGAS